MTYKDTKQTQERYAIKKSSKWKTAGSVLVASLIFGSSVVLNENKASADETNTESTLSTVTTGETTADLRKPASFRFLHRSLFPPDQCLPSEC